MTGHLNTKKAIFNQLLLKQEFIIKIGNSKTKAVL